MSKGRKHKGESVNRKEEQRRLRDPRSWGGKPPGNISGFFGGSSSTGRIAQKAVTKMSNDVIQALQGIEAALKSIATDLGYLADKARKEAGETPALEAKAASEGKGKGK